MFEFVYVFFALFVTMARQLVMGTAQRARRHALDGFSSARYLLPMEVYYALGPPSRTIWSGAVNHSWHHSL